MKILNAYIPVDRQIALAAGHQFPRTAQGGVLFADFRGFTPMTDSLLREFGPNRGADEMAAWLEKAFSSIIKPVHKYMGSVITLSGDSMVCWFDNQPLKAEDGLPTGAIRATACALKIRQAMEDMESFRTPSGNEMNLGIKVTVTAGEVSRFLVGDPENQLFEVITGSAIRRSADVDHALNESEIAVGSEVIGHFGAGISLGDWRTGKGGEHFQIVQGLPKEIPETPWTEQPVLDEEITRAFIPDPVFERIKAGQSEFLADLRPVTPMFINFSGIDFDLDISASEKLDKFIRWVQSVLRRYEGTLLQITIGDKGSYLYVAFGAPIAHEDDPSRAAHAAFELRSLPSTIDYVKNLRIGISHGLTYTGAYGGSNRRIFGALGNEVNISARLMALANPAEILVSERVVKAVGHEFQNEERGIQKLKGVSKSIPVHALTFHRHRAGRNFSEKSNLIGREKEISSLRSALSEASSGNYRSIIIEGESGIGKSILLEQWASEVRELKTPIFEGNGSAVEKTTAYFIWRQVFQMIFGLEEQELLKTGQDKVLHHLEQFDLTPLAPLLNRVLTLNFPETSTTSQMDNEGRSVSTRALLINILKNALKDKPAVIILDDCQYSDSDSWKLITSVKADIPNALLVLSSRPQESGSEHAPEYIQLKNNPENNLLPITRLDKFQTADLIRHRLNVKHVPDLLIESIMNAAEGHPFFSEELAYALREAGILKIQNDRGFLKTGFTSLVDLNFPLTVQGVITSRIDRLDSHKQLTLKTASVIGRIFPFQTLKDIHPSNKEQQLSLNDQLDSLNRMDLVLPEAIEPSLRYIFKHSITHGVVYQSMTQTQRKSLHHSAAKWYETRFANNLSSYFALLAFHWARAEETQKAIDYYQKAGEEALKNFAHEEAVTLFNEALQIDAAAGYPSPTARRALWELKAGEACIYWTKYEQGREHLETGLRLLNYPVPDPGVKSVFPLIGVMAKQYMHRFFPTIFLQSKKSESANLQAASRASQRLIESYYHSGDMLRATYLTFSSLNLAEMADESAELVEAYAGAAPFFYFIGLANITDKYFRRANKVNEHVNNLHSLAFLRLVQCGVTIGLGRWEEARKHSLSLIEAGQQLGSIRRQNDGMQHLAIMLLTKSAYNACIAQSETLLASAKTIRDNRFQGYALFGFAYSSFFLGKQEECKSYLSELRQIFTGSAPPTDEQLLLNLNGLNSLYEARYGHTETSLEIGQKAQELMGGAFQTSFFTLPGYLATGEAYLNMWEKNIKDRDLQERSKFVVDALRRFARTFNIGKPAHALLAGWHAFLLGRPSKARRIWKNGLHIAEETQMAYELARIHEELGRRNLGLTKDAQQIHQEIALQIFKDLGVSYELNLTRE